MTVHDDPDALRPPAPVFHPGFPLPVADYRALRDLLAADATLPSELVVAHSRGALTALGGPTSTRERLVLLAPSVPRRRPAEPLLRAASRATARIPVVRGVVSHALRRTAFRRNGLRAPTGAPLDLDAVADRLRRAPAPARGPRSIVVVVARADRRYDDQLRLARHLGARVVHAPGGHLFPLTHPAATAALIAAAV
ncbi:alpha/beta hydrolase [Clavibacter sp. Sh2126]|uniref:alpha/beta hydrolase n=1 Tax=Clavibacter sp. Sh2126 TaxID=3397678 RepID=UPI0039E0D62A